MASTAPAAEPDTADMLAQVDNDPSLLLLGKVDFDAYFASLREEVWPEDTDISTNSIRKLYIHTSQHFCKHEQQQFAYLSTDFSIHR